MEVINNIKTKLNEMTPLQKKLGHFIVDHIDNVAFMSISELAQLNGVSDATVFKFTKLIGYEGYMDFTKDVQKKPPQQTPNISRNQTHRQDVLPRKDNGKRDQKTGIFLSKPFRRGYRQMRG